MSIVESNARANRFPITHLRALRYESLTLTRRHNSRTTLTATDEYDLQDLLEALLKLHFNDVRPEEWTPSYGGNTNRMDFLLKPEQIVVEAKLARKGLGQKELVSRLAEDILYTPISPAIIPWSFPGTPSST